MTTYNGYESYDHWNTALWLSNDEGMYNTLQNIVEEVVYMNITKAQAVEQLLDSLPAKTPDGAAWQKETILDLIDEHYQEQLQWS
jgi:hypothetical protein